MDPLTEVVTFIDHVVRTLSRLPSYRTAENRDHVAAGNHVAQP